MAISAIRWLQLIFAALGLGFATSSNYINGFIVFAFVVAVIYEIVLFVGFAVGRTIFFGRTQTVIELIIMALLLVVSIQGTVTCDKSLIAITTLFCGYILTALFIISTYDGA